MTEDLFSPERVDYRCITEYIPQFWCVTGITKVKGALEAYTRSEGPTRLRMRSDSGLRCPLAEPLDSVKTTEIKHPVRECAHDDLNMRIPYIPEDAL